VFQFAITIVLIAGTAVMTNQMRYIQHKKLGFDAEQVIVLEGTEVMGQQIEAFKEALLKQPGIVSATNSELVPGRPFAADLFRLEEAPDDALVSLQYTYTGFDFAETLGIDLVAGRSLSREYATDSLAVLLNESAVARLGLDEPVGKRLVWPNESTYTIIGVVEDFHTASFRQEIGPVVLLGPDPRNTNRPNLLVSARIEMDDLPRTLAAAEITWKAFAPTQPFRYTFLDQDFAALYRSEHITGRIFSGFAMLAVLIACFGLFGLAAFTATQRTKEIGIRKVLGATVPGIVLLLSREFLKLVGIAFVIAIPVAYFLMAQWLDNFAYRVDMGIGLFLFTGGLALVIALATVSYQSIRAALADPVQSLRYE
ncbi:MAG TPA: FtsX-like permease family protein, partial [Rhodothermales bacterium]|nr:FtsX-like permease family protein [Rhodothermales bacterium]